ALGFTRENVGLQPFCLGGGFLFRTVVRLRGNDDSGISILNPLYFYLNLTIKLRCRSHCGAAVCVGLILESDSLRRL
ncbi:MAG: hypothetical protein KIC74_11390, partial [Neisseria sp.]|nr:hypothetical protein [Neisseria sp.]